MGQRNSRDHHAQLRKRAEKEHSARGQKNELLEERVPLAGYEELYDITRSGRVFPRAGKKALIAGYHHSPSIRITVGGKVVTLQKEQAIAESFRGREEASS